MAGISRSALVCASEFAGVTRPVTTTAEDACTAFKGTAGARCTEQHGIPESHAKPFAVDSCSVFFVLGQQLCSAG